jgi:hypothetical protein
MLLCHPCHALQVSSDPNGVTSGQQIATFTDGVATMTQLAVRSTPGNYNLSFATTSSGYSLKGDSGVVRLVGHIRETV